jgi:DNA processing protein
LRNPPRTFDIVDWNRCSRADARAWLRLCLAPGLTHVALRALLRWAGSPEAVLAASATRIAQVAGEPAARALERGAAPTLVDASLAWLDASDRHLVTWGDPCYPAAILEVRRPPPFLFVEGRIDLLGAPAIAIVGSRNATSQGIGNAQRLACALSHAGLAVVSGMALGVDAAAHRGALAESGSSIAILGTGPDIRYPSENATLARELSEKGCLVSEFPVGTPPNGRNFPRRNRLISGLSLGVLVVEAGMPSGSLTTACLALDQNREVFAVPGSIHSPVSKGCHWLIKQGAKLVECVEDVLEEIGMATNAKRPQPPSHEKCEDDRDPVLAALGFNPATVEQLAARTGLDAGKLAARMSMLEIDGRVVPLPGGAFQRVAQA